MQLRALYIISKPSVKWLRLQSGNAQFGSKSVIFVPSDFEIWRRSLKNNRAPLLSSIIASPYVNQTEVMVRKRLSWVLTSVTMTFDLWPWSLAWTSLWSLVIITENFMMIRWWEHSQKGVTDGQTDKRTENTIHRAAWSQQKTTISWCLSWLFANLNCFLEVCTRIYELAILMISLSE